MSSLRTQKTANSQVSGGASCTINAQPQHMMTSTEAMPHKMHHHAYAQTGYACFILAVFLFLVLFIFWYLILDCWGPGFCCKEDDDEKDCCKVLFYAFVLAIFWLFVFWLIWWICCSSKN